MLHPNEVRVVFQLAAGPNAGAILPTAEWAHLFNEAEEQPRTSHREALQAQLNRQANFLRNPQPTES